MICIYFLPFGSLLKPHFFWGGSLTLFPSPRACPALLSASPAAAGCCFFFFRPCHSAYRILVPRPGIEPMPAAVKAQSPNHWTAREYPRLLPLPLLLPPSFSLSALLLPPPPIGGGVSRTLGGSHTCLITRGTSCSPDLRHPQGLSTWFPGSQWREWFEVNLEKGQGLQSSWGSYLLRLQ